MSLFVSVFLFGIGICVGSFLNVVVLRFGFTERSSERSRCMACDAQIPWYDLLPAVSFFALRGRCRTCGSALSFQYPLLELGVGFLFLFSYLLIPPVLSFWSLAAFAALLGFLSVLAALVAYDLRHTLVPLPFIYALLIFAALASLSQSFYAHSGAPFLDSALGGASLFIFFMAIVLITKGKGMGAGDAYIAGAVGILLGLMRGIEAIMFGVWSGTIVALALLFLSSLSGSKRLFSKNVHVTMKTELPLIPFLAFGTALALYTDLSPIVWAGSVFSAFFSPHP